MSWMKIVLVMVIVSAASAQELIAPAIDNGSFEAELARYKFFSRTGDGAASLGEGRTGNAAHVSYPGAKDWAFTNESRLPAKPGQAWLASAWVKGRGRVTLAVVSYNDGQRISWDIGSVTQNAGEQWTLMQAATVVPEGVDAVQVRLVGNGVTDVLIDDLSLKQGAIKRPDKPALKPLATERAREKLDRGLVAIQTDAGVYLSWRLRESDGADAAFDLYRGETKLTAQPLSRTSDLVDREGTADARYVLGKGAPVAVMRQPYYSIKLGESETVQKIAVADLDGDAQLDLVIKTPNSNVDPYEQYWKKSPGTYKLHAVTLEGKRLWTHDLGWAIEQGIWYSPYVVYDFDGDGKAEVAVKVGDKNSDPRDADGRVTSGGEYVAILDGATGAEITRAPWPSREGFPNYNRYCRNQLGIAYLDGKTPALIVERGTYDTIKVEAFALREKNLVPLWKWEDREEGAAYRGQGAHCLRAADVDGDGRDEVILGSAVIDDNGNGLWSTRMGHPDQCAVGDLDPVRPGLEIAYGYETRQPKNGVCMVDAKTGKILWGLDRPTVHIHSQGLSSDIDPAHPGVEIYGGERDDKEKRYLFTAQGKMLFESKDLGGLAPRAAFWDASPQRELMKGKSRFITHEGKELPGAIEGAFVAAVDLVGDWREEVVTTLPGEMRIYVTTIPAADRRVTLLQDPIYRLDLATISQGYYQLGGLSRLPGFDK